MAISSLLVALIGMFVVLTFSFAKTTVTPVGPATPGCEFKVTQDIAYAFLDAGSQQKADALLRLWKEGMEKAWNGPTGSQTFGVCACKVTFEFNLIKLPAGQDCRDAPAGYHCFNVVDQPMNQRGSVADSHVIPPDGKWNGYGEWTTGTSATDAAHEAGHLNGLVDEYEYKDTNGDGTKELVNKNPQKNADGSLKPDQSIMATTTGSVKVLPEHIEKIMKDAGKTCPDSCCCGNGKIDANKPFNEACDPNAKPCGCPSDQECTKQCQCIGGLLVPICGDNNIVAPEQCEAGAKTTGCKPDQECKNCICVDKPKPPAPSTTPTPAPQPKPLPIPPTDTTPIPEPPPLPPDTGSGSGSGSGSTTPIPVCGNTICDAGESCATCALDCGKCPPMCGDGVCDAPESCSTCVGDCGKCPEPGPVCGDGICDATEACMVCKPDCGDCSVPTAECGNGICELMLGENTFNCLTDCPLP